MTFDEDAGTSVEVQLNSVQTADSIYVTASGVDETDDDVVYGGVSEDDDGSADGTPENYLLNREDQGGVGTIVTVETDEAPDDGTISVIGEVDGEESVLQTFNYEAS